MDLGAGILGSLAVELHLPEMFPQEKGGNRKEVRDIVKGMKFVSVSRVIFERCKKSLNLVFSVMFLSYSLV